MNIKNGWYVLYVKSRWEKKVYESLKNSSIESFLPQINTIRKWSDRKKTVLKPLFSSYVFVNVRSSLEFYKALSVDGVCAYIRFGKEYAQVTEKEITQIRFLVGDYDITDVEINYQYPKIGEIKKITYGLLSGLECKVIKVGGNANKVIVQIDSLQQSIIANIPSYYFEEFNASQKN